MNNKGYAVSAIIYPLLLVSLILVLSIIYNLNGKYELLNNTKQNIKDEVNNSVDVPNDYEATYETTQVITNTTSSTYQPTTSESCSWCTITSVSNYGKCCSDSYCSSLGRTDTSYHTGTCANGRSFTNSYCGNGYSVGQSVGYDCKTTTSCNSGDTYNGSQCVKTTTTYSCPDGYISEGSGSSTICYKYTCPNGGTLEGKLCKYDKSPRNLKDSILRDNTILTATPTLTTTSSEANDESGLYYSNDTNSGRTTYYFRGNVNNYVTFAGYTWRIIRINEDGTVRMIMTEGINDNTGYPYVTDDADNYLASYYTNSDAKKELENWYNSKLIEYDSYISEGEYCETARITNDTIHSTTLGNETLKLIDEYTPTFKCESDANNYGIVKTKIGLITVDEAIYAGGYADKANLDYYLNMSTTKHILTMSPCGLRISPGKYDIWFIRNWNLINSSYISTNGYLTATLSNEISATFASSLVPVINIYSTVKVLGTGTKDNPYVIQSYLK